MDEPTTQITTDQLDIALGAIEPLDEVDDAGPEELKSALEARGQQWRQWIDELRVRADLADKDARTALDELLAKLEDAYAAFTSLSKDAAAESGTAAKDLVGHSKAVAHDLNRAARAALDALRR